MSPLEVVVQHLYVAMIEINREHPLPDLRESAHSLKFLHLKDCYGEDGLDLSWLAEVYRGVSCRELHPARQR